MERWEASLKALEGLVYRSPEATREVSSKRMCQGERGWFGNHGVAVLLVASVS